MSFDTLGLMPELLGAVRLSGYETPTPIQSQAIPVVLSGRDLIAGAQTGTGKTAAFVLPTLQRLSAAKPEFRHALRALILVPTRELAMQVEESVRSYGRNLPLRSTTVYGGVNIKSQIRALRDGVDILVATPGRLLDHLSQGTVQLNRIEILILDEADRMLDMGFIRDIRKVLGHLPAKRQNLMFSATYSDEIHALASSMMKDPASIEVTRRNSGIELVRHTIHPVDRARKRELLAHLIVSRAMDQVLVFTRTKHGADHLTRFLVKENIRTAAIHGDKSQAQRVRALADFKSGKVQVLVATDIAARGLDIDQLPHVVNFELPHVPEDYVHRSGRTGRAGTPGDALSLVCVDERGLLRDIEKMLRKDLPVEVIPGFEVDPSIKPEPIGSARQSRGAKPTMAPRRRPSGFEGAPNHVRDRDRRGNQGREMGRSPKA